MPLALLVVLSLSAQPPDLSIEAAPPPDYLTPSLASGAGALVGGLLGSSVALSTLALADSQKSEDPTPQLALLNTVNTFAALAGPPLCAVLGGSIAGGLSDGLPAALGAGFGATVGAGVGAVVGLALIPVGDNAQLDSALGQMALRGGLVSALGGIGAAVGGLGAMAALPVE
jgi:hypothetical protein